MPSRSSTDAPSSRSRRRSRRRASAALREPAPGRRLRCASPTSGPPGTFNEDALRGAPRADADSSRSRAPTVYDAILAVERGDAERALVPFENSIEGSVRTTLDTLALRADAGRRSSASTTTRSATA